MKKNSQSIIKQSEILFVFCVVKKKENDTEKIGNEKKSGNFYVLLSQKQHKHVFFTPVDMFAMNSESALPLFVLSFYHDLIWNKEIGFIRGELVDPIHFTIQQARTLTNNFVAKYLQDECFEKDIHIFNHKTDTFNIDEYFSKFDFIKKNLVHYIISFFYPPKLFISGK